MSYTQVQFYNYDLEIKNMKNDYENWLTNNENAIADRANRIEIIKQLTIDELSKEKVTFSSAYESVNISYYIDFIKGRSELEKMKFDLKEFDREVNIEDLLRKTPNELLKYIKFKSNLYYLNLELMPWEV